MAPRITREDLEALARTEAEILSLPSTEPTGSFEPLSSTPEFQAAERGHSHAPVVLLVTCSGMAAICAHHADDFLAGFFAERALRTEGKEDELSVCEDCGRKALDCTRVIMIDRAFLQGGSR